MIDFLSLIFALGVGFGFSCWLFGGLLEKSNNIGDSRGDKFEYKAYPSFTVRRDKMSKSDWQSFSTMYGKNIDAGYAAPKGSEQVRRLTPEELEKWDKEHRALLDEIAPESFDILHYAAITVLRKKG